jgi:hypothetical protein
MKIGDSVQCIADKSTNYGCVGKIYRIEEDIIFVEYPNGETGKGKSKYYKLISSCECGCFEIHITETKSKNIVESIIDTVKNLALSADEKLLRKFGFKDNCGDYTARAREVAMLKLLEDKASEILALAKELDAEEKENKK